MKDLQIIIRADSRDELNINLRNVDNNIIATLVKANLEVLNSIDLAEEQTNE